MQRIHKIVLSGHDNSGSRYILQKISDAFPDVEISVIITRGIYYRKSFSQSVWKLIRESSIIFCAVRAVEMALYRIRGDTVERYCRDHNINLIKTDDINGDDIYQYLSKYEPDLLVSLYTMHIYKDPIISLPRYGAINSHPSILPEYRGLEVFFWALANGEKKTGSSVFFMSNSVDDGFVIRDEVIPLEEHYSMNDVYKLITERGAKLLIQAVLDIDEGVARKKVPVGTGTYFPMPTRSAVWRFLRRGKKFF